MRLLKTFLLWYLPVLAVQLLSGWVTFQTVDTWYQTLDKPFWNPPSWVFGPVWTVLYILMALAAALVSITPAEQAKKLTALALFVNQLLLNGLWSLFFFGLKWPGLALLDLGLLCVMVAITARWFYTILPKAGLMIAPYFAWLAYAFSLNAAIWWLN